jgi:molybdopterin-guanine dinucleotide biosynthesis protein A
LLLQNFAQNDRKKVMTLTAVLLAGGESRRMGRDKATIEFDGCPLWKRQLEILRTLGPEKIFVSARTIPSWLPADTEVLLDDPPSRGPLSGLTKALAAMRTTHLIALAIDMPFMTDETLRQLCDLAETSRGVVPVIGARTEPLAAIYPAEAAADFAEALSGADFSLQRVIQELAAGERVRLVAVPVEDEHLYQSVNEPGDFKEGRFSNRPPK